MSQGKSVEAIRIPAAEVRRLRDACQRFADPIRERLRGGDGGSEWFVAWYDPSELLQCFDRLHLRGGFKLAAYQYGDRLGGFSHVVCIPADRALPPPGPDSASTPGRRWAYKPAPENVPPWADCQIGKYLEGDGSLESYFQSSLFLREVQEIGACWHGQEWSTHEILMSNPLKAKPRDTRSHFDEPLPWEWKAAPPRTWAPRVRKGRQVVEVVFYTRSAFGHVAIYKHEDVYREGYDPETSIEAVADGGHGYLF